MRFDSEHWEELQSLFHLAEQTPESERERVLGIACPNADVLRRALEILAASESKAGRNSAPGADPATALRNIGPYTLIRHVGTGGTGSVYLAERLVGSVIRRMAVKMLAPHAAGKLFFERFQREQRILASLEHPHIVRMLDAGLTGDGHSYLVMEYVDGIHLDQYCDRGKLDVAARLRLFLTICDAVDYAHRNLVVHLDLKPSNLLVTADGTVKLLDFGTSKLLHADGAYSATLMATPAYASPEQLRNQAVTTACDVYSLGVIAFELLSGSRPSCQDATPALMEESPWREPAHLDLAVTGAAAGNRGTTESRLRALLAGDLSTVIRKCLMPAPEDRYASVRALHDDLTRFLEGRPVLARPQTTLYQFSKFVRRNQGRMSLAAMLGIAMAASLFYAWHAQRSALREAQRSVRMQTFMSRLFKVANPNAIGKPEPTVKDFLELGAGVLPQYLRDPEDLRRAQLALAQSLYWSSDYPPAKKLYTEALASAKSAGDVAAEAEALGNLGMIAFFEGRNDEARANVTRALALAKQPVVPVDLRFLITQQYVWVQNDFAGSAAPQLALLEGAIREARQKRVEPSDIAEALNFMGGALQNLGRLGEAERSYTEAIQIYARDPLSQCAQAQTKSGLAGVRRAQNRPAEAVELLQQAYQGEMKCWGPTPYTRIQQAFLGDALVAMGRTAEGLALLEPAEPLWRKPPVNKSLSFTALKYLGYAYVEAGRFREAERVLQDAFELFGKDISPGSKRIAGLQLLWARALYGEGRYREALAHAEVADPVVSDRPNTPLAVSSAEVSRKLLEDLRTRVGQSR